MKPVLLDSILPKNFREMEVLFLQPSFYTLPSDDATIQGGMIATVFLRGKVDDKPSLAAVSFDSRDFPR